MAVITARRADTCGACGKHIPAGTQINYNGPGAVSCAGCPPQKSTSRRAGGNRTGGGRRGYRSSRYVRPSNQRCEDAPCCGCCDVY